MNKLYTLLHSIINTLNRVVRDKVDTSQLNTEVNSALSTAKESGQFDGAPGKDGADGKDGAPGRDGTDGVGITTTTIDGDGQLVIHYSNGTTETLGVVVGTDGKNGVDGTNGTDGTDGTDGIGIAKTEIDAEGKLVITYTDNTTANLGVVVGANGQNGSNGADGVGVAATTINANGELVITDTNGQSTNLGKVVGSDGKDGADGKDGIDGAPGKDGVSVTHEWDGTTLKVTSASGTTSADLKGEPGNSGVYFGSDEPKDDSSKVWIDLSGEGDVLDYVPSPDMATIGQTLVVKAVDENGKPTQWEMVDLSSGVGGGNVSYYETSFVTEQDVKKITFTLPVDAVKFYMWKLSYRIPDTGATDKRIVYLDFGGGFANLGSTDNFGCVSLSGMRHIPKHFVVSAIGRNDSHIEHCAVGFPSGSGNMDAEEGRTDVSIEVPNSNNVLFPTGTEVWFWGVYHE